MAVAHDVKGLLRAAELWEARGLRPHPPLLRLPHWPELAAVLPDGGFPRGVVELSAPRALGGTTSVGLAAVRAGQSRAEQAWCAWIDPEGSLHAPGVVASGVDLGRLLVVRPPRAQIGRVTTRVVGAGAVEVVVVDVDAADQPAPPGRGGQ